MSPRELRSTSSLDVFAASLTFPMGSRRVDAVPDSGQWNLERAAAIVLAVLLQAAC